MAQYIVYGIIVLAFLAWEVYVYIRDRRRKAEPKKVMASIPLLLSKPLNLEEPLLRSALSKGFGTDFSTNTDSAFVLPVIEGAQYMVKNIDTMYMLHNLPTPFFANSDVVARNIKGDDVLAMNLAKHSGWLSFDVISSERPLAEQYDLIGSVLAELAPEQTIAFFVVEKGIIIRFDPERREQLRGPGTLKKLGFQ